MSHAKHAPFKGSCSSGDADVVLEVEASRPLFDALKEVVTTKVPNPEFKAGQGMNALVCDLRINLLLDSPVASIVSA